MEWRRGGKGRGQGAGNLDESGDRTVSSRNTIAGYSGGGRAGRPLCVSFFFLTFFCGVATASPFHPQQSPQGDERPSACSLSCAVLNSFAFFRDARPYLADYSAKKNGGPEEADRRSRQHHLEGG